VLDSIFDNKNSGRSISGTGPSQKILLTVSPPGKSLLKTIEYQVLSSYEDEDIGIVFFIFNLEIYLEELSRAHIYAVFSVLLKNSLDI
jgi:hypothetical protein